MQAASALDFLQVPENSLGMRILGILSANRREWIYVEIASMGLGITTSGLCDKDTDEQLAYKLEKLKLKYICTDKAGLQQVLRVKSSALASDLEFVICFDRPEEHEKKMAAGMNLGLFEFRECKNFETKATSKLIEPKSTCMLSFTSGTTDLPKLVRISHENLMSNFTAVLHGSYKLSTEDVHLTSTHLSIPSELVLVYVAMIYGASIGISTQFLEDLKTVRPTIIFALPRYLDFLYAQMQNDISLHPQMLQKLFNKSYAKKLKHFVRGEDLKKSFWDNVIFKEIREKFGGRVRLIFTGTAISNADTIKFFRIVLACDIIESYGLMEAGGFCLSAGKDRVLGHVGGPLSSCEIKLNYCADIEIEGLDRAKYGELCIRNTTSASIEYLDKAIIDSDCWVHTGDLFRITEEMTSFKYIDRIEYMIKNSLGKSVAPQGLEMMYRQSNYVAQIILQGDCRINCLVAVVVPDERFIMRHCDRKGMDYAQVCTSEAFAKELIRSLEEIWAGKGAREFERVRDVMIEPVPWTSQEFITSTLKVRRNAVISKYERGVQEMIRKIVVAN